MNHSTSSISESDADSTHDAIDQSNGHDLVINNTHDIVTNNGEQNTHEDHQEDNGQSATRINGNKQDIFDCLPQEAKDEIVRYREVANKAKDAYRRIKTRLAAQNNGSGLRHSSSNGTQTKPEQSSKQRIIATQDSTIKQKTQPNSATQDTNLQIVEILRSLTQDARPVATKQNPPKYGGNPEEALSWLQAYKLVCKANNWNDSTMARNLITAMTGTAQEWLIAKFPEGIDDFPRFEREFTIEMVPAGHRVSMTAKLYTTRQEKEEMPTAFLTKLRRIASQCNPPARDPEIIESFRANAHSTVVRSVLFANTMVDLIDALKTYERKMPREPYSSRPYQEKQVINKPTIEVNDQKD